MNFSAHDGHRRAALFVDFENVYIGLKGSSEDAAQQFATQPGRWVQWMEEVLGPFLVELDDQPRKVLRRICYLEPRTSGRFRPYFTRAGFRVVDCPALTSQGKNSADIHMVLDILDTLAHPTRYDEFIVLSVDADFTPVLLRLREHDRRTAMLLSGPAAAAMQAACDFVIPDSVFIDEALDLGDHEEPASASVSQPAASRTNDDLRQQMSAVVRQLVATASEPVPLATAAHALRKQFGQQVVSSHWAGSGGFGKFLAQIVDDHLRVDRSRPPGFVYDPTRHTLNGSDELDVPDIARRVSQLTGTPLLEAATYAMLFDVVATDMRVDKPTGVVEAAHTAAGHCKRRGSAVAASQVRFVLVGLQYAGADWQSEALDGHALAAAFAKNVVRLALAAQMELTEAEQDELRLWIAGEAHGNEAGPPAITQPTSPAADDPEEQ